MPRRKHNHSSKKRRGRKANTAMKKSNPAEQNYFANTFAPAAAEDNDGPHPAVHPQPRSDSSSTATTTSSRGRLGGNNKRPMSSNDDFTIGNIDGGGTTQHHGTILRFKKMRRCRNRSSSCPAVLVQPATPLPLACYQPASLFAILLVASLLPKNTFSLRWLALSGGIGGETTTTMSGAAGLVRKHGGSKAFAKRNGKVSSSLLAMALDREVGGSCSSSSCDDDASLEDETSLVGEDRALLLSLWKDVAVAFSKTIRASSGASSLEETEEEWSVDSILGNLPRGGGSKSEDKSDSYAGLVNLGNTCYLNAQLQCAYHVPYLRELVLSAKDEMEDEEGEEEEGGRKRQQRMWIVRRQGEHKLKQPNKKQRIPPPNWRKTQNRNKVKILLMR
mmetsp:Transcript_6268/g.13789  ORF Transcript_6268/g.13789 Transcript_6268/m.13789 type:complete len:390 (-) Transcript_6268:1220-2389(-)